MPMDAYALIQLATSFLGALGFALFFNVSIRRIPIAAIGGLLTWAIYWALFQLMGQIFVPCVIASTFAAAYAEIAARLCRIPTTVFFIIAVIPLVPGRGLFYTMSDAVNANWDRFAVDSTSTLLFAAGIAAGICIVTACVQTWKYGQRKLKWMRQRKDS